MIQSNTHFYKIRTRLGMINLPFKGTKLNIGVEEGADEILSSAFLSTLEPVQIDQFTFPKPEALKQADFFKVLSQELQKLRQLINQTLQGNQLAICIGGDHSLSLASILALLDRVPNSSQIGYIQFDSHPDMMTYQTSTTKNFHGMYLRPLVKTPQGIDFDIPQINQLVSRQLLPENMLFIGNLDPEVEEKRFMKENGIRHITRDEIQQDKEGIIKFMEEFIVKFKYLHINFDIDVFDQSLVEATGCPNPNGLFEKDVFPLLKIISAHPRLSIDLVEVNPKKPKPQKTIKVAQSVLRSIIKA